MSKPSAVLEEPLTLGQETISRDTRWSSRLLVPVSLLVGFVCAVSLSPLVPTSTIAEEDAISMYSAKLANPSAMRGSSVQPLSCPRGAPIPVNAMLENLQKNGIPASPLAKFALTRYAATRDVSMAAQVKEEFAKLDPETQDKLKKLSRDIVVRAGTLKPQDLAGITAPLGFFDPAGLSQKGDVAIFRKAELKHGRVCMLATLGMVVSEKFHPIFDGWGEGEFVSAVASHFVPTTTYNFWPVFWGLTAGHEALTELGRDPYSLGDYGFDPLNLKPEKPEELLAMQNKEINNGRLAMLAAAGIMAQELVTGKKIF